jgi:hypothetical protein
VFCSSYLGCHRFVCCYCVLVEEGIMRKGEVMRPFRAPRSRVGQTGAKASPTRQSRRRTDKPDATTTKRDTEDNEGPTELRVTRWLIPETEEGHRDITERERSTNALLPIQASTSTATSPAVSEFETYLQELSSKAASSMETSSSNNVPLSSTLPSNRPAHLTKDEWFESVLRAEQERVKQLEMAHLVPVNEMFFDTVSSDDDVPIVNTLQSKTAKAKTPKKVKTLWTYETVEEPTGIRSNYWDAVAPKERATKQLAKQKIDNIKDVETQAEGAALPMASSFLISY